MLRRIYLSVALCLLLTSMADVAMAGGVGRVAELGVHNAPACSSKGHQGVENVDKFGRWLGRRPDRVLDFAWWNTWPDMIRSTDILSRCWHDAGYRRLAFSIALVPKDKVSSLQAGASGAYDSYFRTMASTLIANGYGDAIIRLGWEFNLVNFPWAAGQDPAAYVTYYRRAVDAMRSVPGANFRFDWNPAIDGAYARPGHVLLPDVYPGDRYVDIIGLDIYNQWWGPPNVSPQDRWLKVMNQPYGLKWHRDFAAQHGKPISFPEWGTGTRPDGHGSGDDAYFIAHMAQWIATNNVAYHDYWDEMASDFNSQLSNGQFPASGAAFLQAFGSPSARKGGGH